MYQKAGRNRPKEQSNIIYSSTCKNTITINRLGFRRICFCFENIKACKIIEKNLKKMQEYQKHRKRQQNLNISDLETTFNSSDKNCKIYFRRKPKNTIISKIKTEQHVETYDLTSIMANSAAQMLKNISKSVCVSLGFSPSILNSFSENLASKFCIVFAPSSPSLA